MVSIGKAVSTTLAAAHKCEELLWVLDPRVQHVGVRLKRLHGIKRFHHRGYGDNVGFEFKAYGCSRDPKNWIRVESKWQMTWTLGLHGVMGNVV